jgi:hypothetical protein
VAEAAEPERHLGAAAELVDRALAAASQPPDHRYVHSGSAAGRATTTS